MDMLQLLFFLFFFFLSFVVIYDVMFETGFPLLYHKQFLTNFKWLFWLKQEVTRRRLEHQSGMVPTLWLMIGQRLWAKQRHNKDATAYLVRTLLNKCICSRLEVHRLRLWGFFVEHALQNLFCFRASFESLIHILKQKLFFLLILI